MHVGRRDSEELKEQLRVLATKMVQENDPEFILRYPWIFVRVLPPPAQKGSILLTDKQNRVLYEGLVLRTWQPYWAEFEGELHDENGVKLKNIRIHRQSEFEIGDIAVFPHFAGMAYAKFDAQEYRLVKEVQNWVVTHNDACVARMDFGPTQDELEVIIANQYMGEDSIVSRFRHARELMNDYYLVSKDARAVTLSGV